MRSKSEDQLSGEYLPVGELDDCDNKKRNSDSDKIERSYGGDPLDESAPMTPCGIYPSYFPRGILLILNIRRNPNI